MSIELVPINCSRGLLGIILMENSIPSFFEPFSYGCSYLDSNGSVKLKTLDSETTLSNMAVHTWQSSFGFTLFR